MTPEKLREIEEVWQCDASFKRCPSCGARPHKEYGVIALLAEVRRLQKENAYLKVKKWAGGTDFANGEAAGNG